VCGLHNNVSGLSISRKFGAILCVFLIVASIFSAAMQLGLIIPNRAFAAITIIPPPDKTVTSSGSSTQVYLGSPTISGTTDSTPTISNNVPGSAQVPSGAVAYWSFNEDFTDSSSYGNDGSPKGDASLAKTTSGNALSLDGSGDYVSVSDSSSLRITGAFSISAWIKLDTTSPDGNYVRILEKGTSPGDKYWMYYVKSTKKIGFGFTSADVDSTIHTTKTDWQAGQWYHVVGTYDPAVSSNNMKIYVNGALDTQETKTGKPLANYDPLMIGTKSSANWDFWQGDIDALRIYKRALTSTEAANLYKPSYATSANLPPGTNVITWKVTDDSGSSASAIQVINVVSSTSTAPVTSLAINGKRYVDPTSGVTFVRSTTAFDLSVDSSTSLKGTYYRYFDPTDSIRPTFSTGTFFKVIGDNGKYTVQYYSIDINGKSESLRQKDVVLDNTAATTSISVIDSSTGKVRLTTKDNSGGSGIAGRSNSGIYYKIDAAASYTFTKASTIDLTNVANGAHTIYYYSMDNVENQENVKSTKYSVAPTVTYTFCASGCKYNDLQTAINALPSGGKVYVKDGSYTISKTIYLKSNMILEFSSLANIYFTGDGITLFKGSSITNVQIIGGDITAEYAGVDAMAFYSSKTIKVTGTQAQLVKGASSSGLYCSDCIDVSISNVDFSSATRMIDIKNAAKVTDSRSSNIWVQNSRFEDASEICVKVNYSKDVHIIGNYVTKCVDNGIDIGSNLGSEVRGNSIINTGMPNGVAIHTDEATDALIKDNIIDTTGESALSIYRVSDIDVIGNTIKNAGGNAINIITTLEPSSYIIVKSNRIVAPDGHGIYVAPSQLEIDIINNTFDNLLSGKQAVYVSSPNLTTTVSGNIVT